MYINKPGLFGMLITSQMKEANKFKQWIINDVLPSIDKTGKYELYEDNAPSSFYSDNFIYKYEDKRVVYLGYCCNVDGEQIFKYGISSDIFRRDYTELRRDILGFKIIYVRECVDNDKVEASFEKQMKLMSLIRSIKFNGKQYTELFTTTKEFDIEKAKQYIDELIDDKKLQEQIDPEKYKYLCEIEKSKQESEKSKRFDKIMERFDKTMQMMENDMKNNSGKNEKLFETIMQYLHSMTK